MNKPIPIAAASARIALVCALGWVCFGSAAFAQAAPPSGEALVRRNCAQCHAIGPQDRSPMAAAPAFRELGRNYPVDDLGEALAEGILSGHPAMPEFRFSPDEVNAIIKYLESVQTRRRAALFPPVSQ